MYKDDLFPQKEDIIHRYVRAVCRILHFQGKLLKSILGLNTT